MPSPRPGQNVTTGEPPIAALSRTLCSCRPWSDSAAVQAKLARYLERSGQHPDLLALADVAEVLRKIGKEDPGVKAKTIASVAFYLLRNVVQGRNATDYSWGFGGIHESVISPRNRRRYAEPGGFDRWLSERFQQDLDIAALFNDKGYSLTAARAWLRRHPGLHAKDAPAPHRPRPDWQPSARQGLGSVREVGGHDRAGRAGRAGRCGARGVPG